MRKASGKAGRRLAADALSSEGPVGLSPRRATLRTRRWRRVAASVMALGAAGGLGAASLVIADAATTPVAAATSQPELLCLAVKEVNVGICIGDPVPARLPI